MDPSEIPELIVGVDFGMTYTGKDEISHKGTKHRNQLRKYEGVAYVNTLNPSVIHPIVDWPPLSATYRHETKVPSKISYTRNNTSPKWGFLCEGNEDNEEVDDVVDCFKIYLDRDNVEASRRAGVHDTPTQEQAKAYVGDYLRRIYLHVKSSIENTTGSWIDKKIEFIFTMPTTWTSQAICTSFEEAIRSRGSFGSENEFKHTTKLELTEAEAAAVFVVANPQVRFAARDIILVCDAGGGTTDLGLVEIQDPSVPALKQVAAVNGVGIGSTMIDTAFQLLVQRRMDAYPGTLQPDTPHRLARSPNFQSIKHNFGAAAADQLQYKLGNLGIGQEVSHPGLKVERGKMIFSREEIQGFFDVQIAGIARRIDTQLDWMQKNRSSEYVKYLVLSGGLGGSEYVKRQLEDRFSRNQHPAAPNMTIIKSADPRLAVVKGLLMDRRQKLFSPHSIMKTRIARASYAVLCRRPYDSNIHIGEDVEIDSYKKNARWAINQFDWLIRKGDTIESDSSKEREFFRRMNPGAPASTRNFDVAIYICHNDRDKLPRSTKQSGALKLCMVHADMKEVLENEFDLKNKRFWQGKKYYLVDFTVRVIIAPADLKFELWFRGKRYNRSHDPVKIDWDVGAVVKPQEDEEDIVIYQGNSQDSGEQRSARKYRSAYDLRRMES